MFAVSLHHIKHLVFRHFYTHDPPHYTKPDVTLGQVAIMLGFWLWCAIILGGVDALAFRLWWPIGVVFLFPVVFLWPVVCEIIRTVLWAARRCTTK